MYIHNVSYNCQCTQINCVVMKGLNDDEICDFVALTEHKVRLLCAVTWDYYHCDV